MLRFIQGMSVSETAAVMGKNDGAIKALQHRAVRKLADLVGSELPVTKRTDLTSNARRRVVDSQ